MTSTTKTPRPGDIKVTSTLPTLDQLKEYRAAWLQEGEESGIIDDLFLIVKTFGIIPEKRTVPGRQPLRRFTFTDGNSDYFILLDRELWGVGIETLVAWERVTVMEEGKMLVDYFRRLELSPAERNTLTSDSAKIERNSYVPGYWTGLIKEFAKDAKHELGKASTNKAQDERTELLNTLNLGINS